MALAQTITTTTRRYTDLDFSFLPHPVTGDLVIATGDVAVVKAVRNLVRTAFYERPFHPELGCGVPAMLFEPLTPLTAQRIKRHVEDAITNFEPRARLIDVIVSAIPTQKTINITVKFFIANNTEPTSTTVFLERTR